MAVDATFEEIMARGGLSCMTLRSRARPEQVKKLSSGWSKLCRCSRIIPSPKPITAVPWPL